MTKRVRQSLSRSRAVTLIEILVVVFVVVIIAVMLAGWIIVSRPAREKARRSSCMSNLKQIGIALESYCSDYSEYFPCYPGWDERHDPSRSDAGVTFFVPAYKDISPCVMTHLISGDSVRTDEPLSLPQFGGTPIGNGCGQAFPGVNFFRTVFFGSPAAGSTMNPGDTGFAGPVGLGNLLLCNYLGDAGVLMCPSAGDMPWDAGARYAGITKADLAILAGNAGSGDARTLWTGNYPALAAKHGGHGWQGLSNVYGFQSSYNYRGVPISAANALPTNMMRRAETCANFADTVRPSIIAFAGCPQFKTTKQLADRAIVSDTFSKWDDAGVPAKQKQGYGLYAHKDGYNVLYGDGHVSWYGDPRKTIMNGSQSAKAGTPLDQADISASIATIAYATAPDENPHKSYAVLPDKDITPSEGFLIWHRFDTSSGIDLPRRNASPSGASAAPGR